MHAQARFTRDGSGVEYRLVAAHTLFGRTDSCQVRLADSTVSAQHLEVSHKGERWYAEDLGSKNGTRLNGTPINPWSPAPLADGDVLKLGNCLVRIEISRQPFVTGTGPVDPKRRQIKLTGNQRQFAAALVRQYRTPGLLAPRAATREEIADATFQTERNVTRVADALAAILLDAGHNARERLQLLAEVILRYRLARQRD